MMTLHGYWRSSASYRVRIALALKGVDVNHAPVNLKAGEQLEVSHQSLNAQPFVPILELEDGTKLTQSLAIMDYLDATFREPPLMPSIGISDYCIRYIAYSKSVCFKLFKVRTRPR